jgi:ribose transport system ATP-binding protein
VLELRSISKRFPGVQALNAVSLSFAPGEIHALVGENGAGKSTLIKIITGVHQPDSGQIFLGDEPVRFRSNGESLARGIGIVNQEIQVVPEASVAENIMLDKLASFSRAGIINWKRLKEKAREAMDRVGLEVDPGEPIGGLSAAQKQQVQIARALSAQARILLLDEPTSSITEHEAERLFVILRELRERGVAIIFVSHKFDEVYAISDRVSVLRDGEHIATRELDGLERNELIEMMIGRQAVADHFSAPDLGQRQEVLRVENLYAPQRADSVSFSLCEGEILGLYGLVGAGRSEVARLLVGVDRAESGSVYIRGQEANIDSMATSLYQYGMGYVSENRKEEGLFLEATIKTNIGLTIWQRIAHRFSRCISSDKERKVAEEMVETLDIRATGVDQVVEDLSGGNQQKVSIAKWLAAGCDILIIDEPTVGVDVGAKAHIHRLIWDLATKENRSILLISSDMPELIRLAQRILIFKDKRIVHEIEDPRRLSYDEVSRQIGRHLN